ncbi:hypothetical protein [Cohnella yongneupensis]|uniref:Uncharacterized protein n=1 Tax=Cohnella yongneupensis TaxID=425006 RepID=A0ABW0R0G6_9BACL
MKSNLFVFTNPNTVEGTMNQARRLFENNGRTLQAESIVLPGTFELIMQGKKEQYVDEVSNGLIRIARDNPGHRIVAAQLSMVPAAQTAGNSAGVKIGNALDSLTLDLGDLLV